MTKVESSDRRRGHRNRSVAVAGMAILVAIWWNPTATWATSLVQLNPPLRLYVFDLKGDGVKLTSVKGGIDFDVDSSGTRVRTSWTAAGSDDAFIVVKPQSSGNLRGDHLLGTGLTLPDGRRLINPDRALMAVQGFELGPDFRTIDNPANRAKVVTLGPEDAIYSTARVWTDQNHDGRSAPEELRSLAEAGILRINSRFRIRRVTDENGNVLGPLGNFATLVNGVEVWRDVQIVQFAR